MNNMSSIAVISTPDSWGGISQATIDSIISQTLKPKQLIIAYEPTQVEHTTTLQSRWQEEMPSVQLKHVEYKPDTTYAAIKNDSLNCINDCEYIHFINSDIHLPRDFYQKAIQGLNNHSDCVAAVAAQLKLTNSPNAEIDLSRFAENPWLWLMCSKSEIASAVVLRRSVVERAGRFNPLLRLGEDTDLFARISMHGAWHCLSGCVVTQSLSYDEVDLQSQFPDYHRRWALIYDNLLDTYGARNYVPRRTYRKILAKAWYEAGVELASHQRINEAHDCFTRSVSWRLFNPSFKYLMRIPRLRDLFGIKT